MKLKTVKLKRPRHLIQIFRKLQTFDKKQKFDNYGQPKPIRYIEWGEKICINQNLLNEKSLGYLDTQTNQLFISPNLTEDAYFVSGQGILLIDNHTEGDKHPELNSQCCGLRANLGIFEISLADMEVYLRYSYLSVGIPKRDNFKLCELKVDQPVEILINGKFDHTGSSGKQRTYKEQSYIIEYLGKFSECKVLRKPIAPIYKDIPKSRKTVDLRKILY